MNVIISINSILIILSYKLNFRNFPVFSNFYAKIPILTPKCVKSCRWISVNVNRLNYIKKPFVAITLKLGDFFSLIDWTIWLIDI